MNWQPAERPTLDGPFISGTLDLGMKALKNLVDFRAHQRQNGKRRRKRKKP
jgi:hypothetical protein